MLNLLFTSSGVPLRAGSSKIPRFLAFLGLFFRVLGFGLVRFASNILDFALKIPDFASKISDFASKISDFSIFIGGFWAYNSTFELITGLCHYSNWIRLVSLCRFVSSMCFFAYWNSVS